LKSSNLLLANLPLTSSPLARFLLTCFLRALLISLILAGLSRFPRTAQASPLGRETKATLCGRLVFLQTLRTRQNLLGLIPCGQFKPIIFDSRPGELHDFYRFTQVVTGAGREVMTADYGKISTYIFKFETYTPIKSCSECSLKAPTATPDPAEASLACSRWVLEFSATEFAFQAPQLAEEQLRKEILAGLQEVEESAQDEAQCGDDHACVAQALAVDLGNQLGVVFRESEIQTGEVVALLRGLFSDPQAVAICQAGVRPVWDLVIGLDQQGYAIAGLSVTSPATALVLDASGRRAGVLEDGALAQEIPNSAALVSGNYKIILFPSGSPAEIRVRGAGFGSMDLELIDFSASGVSESSFKGILATRSTRGELRRLNGRLVLQMDFHTSGQVETIEADQFQDYPIENSWLPTLTPANTSTPTSSETLPPKPGATDKPVIAETPAASPSPLASPSPIPGSPFQSVCPAAAGLAGLVILWRRRRKNK
jgi:hypothetical protein